MRTELHTHSFFSPHFLRLRTEFHTFSVFSPHFLRLRTEFHTFSVFSPHFLRLRTELHTYSFFSPHFQSLRPSLQTLTTSFPPKNQFSMLKTLKETTKVKMAPPSLTTYPSNNQPYEMSTLYGTLVLVYFYFKL